MRFRSVYPLFFVLLAGCANPLGRNVRDPVSSGSAKLFLKVGKTSAADVLEAFGGPNVVAGDSDGKETWTYDRMSYSSEVGSLGGAAGGGGGAGPAGGGGLVWFRSSRAHTSSRSVTLYIYWENGVLKEYRYRSASF